MKMLFIGIAIGVMLCILADYTICAPKDDVWEADSARGSDTIFVEVYRDTAIDKPPQYIKVPMPNDTDTLYYPIDSLPLDSMRSTAGYDVWLNDVEDTTIFELVFFARGRAEYYKIRPIINRYSRKATTKRASLLLYGDALFNQGFKFEGVGFGMLGFYRSIGLHGRIEMTPVLDSVHVTARFGFAYKIKEW